MVLVTREDRVQGLALALGKAQATARTHTRTTLQRGILPLWPFPFPLPTVGNSGAIMFQMVSEKIEFGACEIRKDVGAQCG